MSRRLSVFSLFSLLFIGLLFQAPSSWAAKTVWKQANNPANYVALEGIKEAKGEDLVLNHPYTFDPKKLADMFLSLRYNKALMLRKDIEDRQVFFDVSLLENKFIPHIVEAFQKATPDQTVVISIVQKDPYFILRNDRLSVMRTYMASDGFHIQFLKTDAKLMGDYQAKTTGTKMIESAKGLGITLDPQEGQKLSFNRPNEIVLDPNYDFAALVDKKTAEDEAKKEAQEGKKKRSEPRSTSTAATPASSTTPAAPAAVPAGSKTSTTDRLAELKKLKDQGLITNQEYEAKKKEILKDL